MQAIENPAEQAGTESHGQGAFGADHRFADAEAAVLFKNLYRGNGAIKTHYLSGQAAAADKDTVTDFQVGKVDAYCRAADAGDLTIHLCSLT